MIEFNQTNFINIHNDCARTIVVVRMSYIIGATGYISHVVPCPCLSRTELKLYKSRQKTHRHDNSSLMPTQTPQHILDVDTNEKEMTNESQHAITPVPTAKPPLREGGIPGYLTVLGAFLALFATFGQMNAFGSFQLWYSEHQLSSYSSSDISWIGSLQLWVFFFSVSVLALFNSSCMKYCV